jgi:hypothetical protein
MEAAHARGVAIAACRSMRQIETDGVPPGPFNGAVILFQLEKARDPVAVLRSLHRVLAADAVLLVVTPSLDSWPARVLRGQWTEWQPGNRTYFDTQTIQSALLRAVSRSWNGRPISAITRWSISSGARPARCRRG